MKNIIWCCISCILPCGALDVIRIVHPNGRVEELSGTIRAGDIMKAHPKYVLRKPTLYSSEENVLPRIMIVPPEAELRRGKIYFLMPVSSLPEKIRSKAATRKKKQKELECNTCDSVSMSTKLLISSDQYLSEILSEKVSTQRDRRRGRVGVWRPNLESITELPTEL